MAEQRTNRDAESREVETRASDSWLPASVLPNPAPQDGWVFRWVRTSTLGHADNTNVSQKFREGWVPVKAEDHPELEVMSISTPVLREISRLEDFSCANSQRLKHRRGRLITSKLPTARWNL